MVVLFSRFFNMHFDLFFSWASLVRGEILCSKPGGKRGPSKDEEEDLEVGLRSGPNLFEVRGGDGIGEG